MGFPKSHFRVCWFLSVGALHDDYVGDFHDCITIVTMSMMIIAKFMKMMIGHRGLYHCDLCYDHDHAHNDHDNDDKNDNCAIPTEYRGSIVIRTMIMMI